MNRGGGHWDYQQKKLDQLIEDLPAMLQFVQDCLNAVDLLSTGDVGIETTTEKLIQLTKELGDRLYG
jgi:hypothetical protein